MSQFTKELCPCSNVKVQFLNLYTRTFLFQKPLRFSLIDRAQCAKIIEHSQVLKAVLIMHDPKLLVIWSYYLRLLGVTATHYLMKRKFQPMISKFGGIPDTGTAWNRLLLLLLIIKYRKSSKWVYGLFAPASRAEYVFTFYSSICFENYPLKQTNKIFNIFSALLFMCVHVRAHICTCVCPCVHVCLCSCSYVEARYLLFLFTLVFITFYS